MKFLLNRPRRFPGEKVRENIVSKEYIDFVNSVTSDHQVKCQIDFVVFLMIMEEQGAVPSRLLTTALGLNGEASEFSELD